MPEPLPSMAGRVLAGRYRVVRPIARGGMAEVWEGHDDVLARAVAVKILHPHLADDEDFLERFRREAVAAARLAHPGIVATFDAGTDDGVAFIVMELVQGRTLRQALEEGGPLAPELAVRVAAEVAAALDHAHGAGLVHRDVKPANILLVDHDGRTPSLQVKVADFGIARQTEQGIRQLTATGAVVGTAKYLAPEQVVGRPLDARTDVYALGVVLYEMLCGRTPFEAETELATALQHVRSEPPAPTRFRDGIPQPLEGAVLRAMAKEPDERYGSAAEFRQALLALVPEGEEAAGTPQVVRGSADAETAAATTDPGGQATSAPAPVPKGAPQLVRDPTPPGGTPPVARPPGRSWVPLAFLAALVGVVVGGGALLLRDPGRPGGDAPPESTAGAQQAVAVASVSSFDPEGSDGTENEAEARLAHDGNPRTTWGTDRYRGPSFGRLKSGVGLILRLAGGHDLRRLEVRSPTRGWSASVYVADQPRRALADWGQPVATQSSIAGDASFDLGGRSGAAILIWITDPGPQYRAEVAEVVVTG